MANKKDLILYYLPVCVRGELGFILKKPVVGVGLLMRLALLVELLVS